MSSRSRSSGSGTSASGKSPAASWRDHSSDTSCWLSTVRPRSESVRDRGTPAAYNMLVRQRYIHNPVYTNSDFPANACVANRPLLQNNAYVPVPNRHWTNNAPGPPGGGSNVENRLTKQDPAHGSWRQRQMEANLKKNVLEEIGQKEDATGEGEPLFVAEQNEIFQDMLEQLKEQKETTDKLIIMLEEVQEKYRRLEVMLEEERATRAREMESIIKRIRESFREEIWSAFAGNNVRPNE